MKLTISRSLVVFGTLLFIGFAAAMGIMFYTLEKVKINSPDYETIVDSKDLIADVVPPPLSAMEPYLLASELVDDPTRAEQYSGMIASLKQAHDERAAYWENAELPDDIRAAIVNELEPVSARFWTEMETAFLPAAKAGNEDAMAASIKQLHGLYEEQKPKVQAVVALAEEHLSKSEALASEHATVLRDLAFAVSGAAFALLLVGLYVFRRRAINPLASISGYMSDLSSGDYDTNVPYLDRTDEIGDMARSVAVFRQDGIEKIRIERENRRQSEASEADRAERLRTQTREAESLQKVVADLGAGLDRLSKFNIRMTLDEPFEERFEQLRHDFNKSLTAFQETMAQVLDKANEIKTNTDALQGSADQLATRTEQQAAALEQTAAALEEITTNVRHSTDRTAETRNKTRNARQNVERSTEVVQNAIDAMQRIEQASGQIGSITNVIDEIAFQTNLLALNAGVEAARAGEAGKGFAVVAQEVRELAQRSAGAAKEIKGLIERSGREVAGGVDLVKRTGQALQEIEGDITGIAGDVEAIALSASEQSTGLAEVNQAINQMDQITQKNAAMVEETTAATHTLADEVAVMVQLVGQFVFNRRSRVRDTPEDRTKTLAMRGGGNQSRAA